MCASVRITRMSDFESIIEKAVEDRVIPGVVLLAKDKSGM